MNPPDYPKPPIPLTPVLSFDRRHCQSTVTASILDCKNIRHITSGRSGIVLALERCKVGVGDEVLVPAFHCESMVAPIKKLGATPVFYRIKEDTSADFDDIVSKASPKVQAIIVTHYFGFPQNFANIQPFCNSRDIKIIEDCAHAFFGKSNDQTIGFHGDYAIASSMKFFPVYDGGILASNTHSLDEVVLSSPKLLFQFKSLINSIENAIHYKRLGLLGAFARVVLSAKTLLWSVIKKSNQASATHRIGPSSSEGGFGLDEEWIYKRASRISSIVITKSDFNAIGQARRKNYLRLEAELKDITNCHPIFSALPDSVVPLVYPLYVEHPKELFPKLKMAGVPIWRFGEYLDPQVTDTLCPISVDYSQHIFQFPCHQSLTNNELDWMIGKIKEIIEGK